MRDVSHLPLFGILVVLLGAPGCEGDEAASSATTTISTTSTGAGGAGGGGRGGGPPQCEAPSGPSGPTPDARADTAGVLGPDGRTFVIFGGDSASAICGQIPQHQHAGDTWLLDAGCGTWTELDAAAPAPPARARHAMA